MVIENRLDRRAEMIKERRYGGLIVANDPKIAYFSDESATEEQEKTDGDETDVADNNKGPATAGMQEAGRSSSQTSESLLSASRSRVSVPKVPISEIRAQAASSSSSRADIQVEDAEDLLRKMSSSPTVQDDSDLPDLGSDDSDGPPSDFEKEIAD